MSYRLGACPFHSRSWRGCATNHTCTPVVWGRRGRAGAEAWWAGGCWEAAGSAVDAPVPGAARPSATSPRPSAQHRIRAPAAAPAAAGARLCKALDLGEHLAHVLGFVHGRGALVVQLVVRVNHQAPDAVAVDRRARHVQHPVHRGQRVVLVPARGGAGWGGRGRAGRKQQSGEQRVRVAPGHGRQPQRWAYPSAPAPAQAPRTARGGRSQPAATLCHPPSAAPRPPQAPRTARGGSGRRSSRAPRPARARSCGARPGRRAGRKRACPRTFLPAGARGPWPGRDRHAGQAGQVGGGGSG